MWASIERNIDGAVGRMLSWLTHPPVRSLEEVGVLVERLAVTVTETVADQTEIATDVAGRAADREAREVEETAEVAAEKAEEVAEAMAQEAAEITEAVEEEAADVAEAGARKVEEVKGSRASARMDRKILAALAVAEGGASMKDLKSATGAQPSALRQRLTRLIEEGRMQRRGKGMRTRYHSTEN